MKKIEEEIINNAFNFNHNSKIVELKEFTHYWTTYLNDVTYTIFNKRPYLICNKALNIRVSKRFFIPMSRIAS